MMPWLAFLFIGVLDFGFYSYAAICTQNAARAAAIATSASATSQTNAIGCAAALGELKGLPNMVGVSTCQTSAAAVSNSIPAAVVIATLSGSACADCAVTPTATSAQATVTYLSLPMIPIPGVLAGRISLTRIAEMRVIIE